MGGFFKVKSSYLIIGYCAFYICTIVFGIPNRGGITTGLIGIVAAYAGLGIMVSTERSQDMPDGEVDNGNFKRIQFTILLLIAIIITMFIMKDFANFEEVGVSLGTATTAAVADKKINERYRTHKKR